MDTQQVFGTAEKVSYQAMRKVEKLKDQVNILYDHYQIPELHQAMMLLAKTQEQFAALQEYADEKTKQPAEADGE